MLPDSVRLVEVGPRDGLQNEAEAVPTEVKAELVRKLVAAGLRAIEVSSFVSPRWVPQLADADALFAALGPAPDGVTYSALVPNARGFDRALEARVPEIAVFAAASESFSQKNINCSIDESLERFRPVCERAAEHGLRVRGYVSCVLGCPYEGEVAPDAVARVSKALVDLGCAEVSLGDTIGVGTPVAAGRLIERVARDVPVARLAAHFHDTYGQALANLLAVVQRGVAVIDVAVGGLGGCPYAPGASGNVATEDVVYMLRGMGIETGVDMDRLLDAGSYISQHLGRPSASKVARALASHCERA